MFFTLISYIFSYLCGVFPSGYLIARAHKVDITQEGSGNIGTTNIARTLGRKAGIFTLLLDAGKGIFALAVLSVFTSDIGHLAWCGALVVLGHCFSIPGKLKGGKGVATSFGVLLFLSITTAALLFAIFAVIFYLTRVVSISSITVAALLPIIIWIFVPGFPDTIPFIVITLCVVYRHKENLSRLMRGEEKRFSLSK